MPFYACSIDTPLAPPTVAERIGALIQPKRAEMKRPFEGQAAPGTFNIVRIISYKKSFLPVIRGSYGMGELGGTRVQLLMHIHPLALLFELVWLGAFSYVLYSRGEIAGFDSRIILGMMLFSVLVLLVSFYAEAVKARRIIRDALMRDVPYSAWPR